MLFQDQLSAQITDIFPALFNKSVKPEELSFQPTRKEFPGDITLVAFGLSKLTGMAPDKTAETIGNALKNVPGGLVSDFNVVKGFLNLEIHNEIWINKLRDLIKRKVEEGVDPSGKPVLIEYSSPNTNKPLHLGHIRNNLLGFSLSRILAATGKNVIKVNVINDRGIHICKSMLAWQKFGNNETPESSGMKGDHLVGKYYVEFDKQYREEMTTMIDEGYTREEAKEQAPLMVEAREMLKKWEEGDTETLKLWNMMNGWVYAGFDVTYRRLGVDFDKLYYESQTYLLGKKIVDEGLAKGVLYRKPDGSVWIDLKDEGLDEKLLLRSDGTSVYMTQDLGTASTRYDEYGFTEMIYVVGNEQDYHFKVLFLILKKLGYDWADCLYHLSYNMVDLPSGKMKSREGTVVDADELIDEMVKDASRLTKELGKIEDFESAEARHLFEMLGLGALKYFILKVDPEKRMLFNPDESIDFNGHTGPFIQYTHARIRSVLRKADTVKGLDDYTSFDLTGYTKMIPKEKELLRILCRFTGELNEAAARFSPSVMAAYAYELAKSYNQFYHDHTIADTSAVETSKFRLVLSDYCRKLIAKSMYLLGIEVPERM